MKILLKIFNLTLIAFVIAQSSDDDKNFYSKRYDSLDVDTIFRSSRLLNNYVDCLLDKKSCPPEGKELKRILPHALRTSCARCTKIQKEKALDVITRLYYQHPSIYLALAERYDADGSYTRNFENWFDQQQKEKLNSQSQNEVPQRARIPSTWITSSTTQKTTTERLPSTMRTLRTLSTTVRTSTSRPQSIRTQPTTKMEKTTTLRSVISSTASTALSQKSSSLNNVKKVPTISSTLPVTTSIKLSTPIPSTIPLTTSTIIPQTSTLSESFSTSKSVQFVPMKIPNQNQFKPLTTPSTTIRPFPQQSFPDQSFQSPVPITPSRIPQRFPSAPLPQIPPSLVNKNTFSVSFGMPQMPVSSTFRTPSVQRPAERPSGSTFPIDPTLIDNFFVPRNVQIQRSINQIFDRTNLMVSNVMRSIFGG